MTFNRETMRSHWTEAKLFKFLRLYKRHECLWNPYSPEYKNSNKKSQSLSEISSEMNIFGLTINECLEQIKYVRQTYKKEQQRLERYASLGGRTFSKLLWYPLMNSMLSKVIRDEEKLNQAQATATLDLVVAPNQVPRNSLDERSRRAHRGSLSWARSETTNIFSYPSNLGYGDYADGCIVATNNFAENEHLGSCPTCGYSNGSSCDCFSMYNSDIIEQSYCCSNSRSQIDYRPRTSYNYRNGILEINSAVRIPVTQPASNCGHGQLMESITPEEPDFQNIEQAQEQNFNLDGYESLELMDSHSYPSNLSIDTSGVKLKCRLRRSERTKRIDVDKILCAQNSVHSMNSTCDSISCEKRGADDDIIDEENLNVHLDCPKLNVIVEEESKTDVDTTCCGTNVEVKLTSRTEENNTVAKTCEVNVEGNEDSITTKEHSRSYNLEVDVESPRSEEENSDEQCLRELIEADSKPCENLVQKPKDVVQRNLTKIVIGYISDVLTKPIEKTKIDAEERIILEKVVKDLKLSLSKEISKDHQKADKNNNTKLCNKTICWREHIVESLNILPCRSTKYPGLPRMFGGSDIGSGTRRNLELSDTELCETKESIHSDSEDVEIHGQAMKARSNSNGKDCENRQEFCDPISLTKDKPEVENGTTIKVSIETSGSTEDEILDKVVNKITDILRQTLDKNGYSMQKKEFFSNKYLTTNDDEEMNRNEAVWRSELANIIRHLMKHKKADDPITFKVKTVILPVKSQSNILPLKIEAEDHETCYNNSLMKSSTDFSGNTEEKVSDDSKYGFEMIIDRSESVLRKIRGISARKLPDKIERKISDEEFKELDSDVLLCKFNRLSQRRKKVLTKQIRQFHKRSRDTLSGRSLRNLTYLNKISIKDENEIVLLYNNDRHKLWKLLKCLLKFRNKSPSMLKEFENLSRNLHTEKNHSNAVGLLRHPVCNVNKDFNVYLCTQSMIMNRTGCYDVDTRFRSIGSNTNDTQPNKSPDSFVAENAIEQSYPKADAVTQTRSNKFWCSDRADGVGIINRVGRCTIEEKSMASVPNILENHCHILNVFSSYNQKMSRRGLKKSEEGKEASSYCADSEEIRENKKHGAADRSESEEAEAMLEARLSVASEKQTKSCCAGDKTSSICKPICDVTSRLRLCTIVKPPNETRETNHHVESGNSCCCDGIIKPRIVSRKSFGIGDASVRSTSMGLQTESIKRESQSLVTDRDCGCNSVSKFRSVACGQNSVVINTRSVLKDEEQLVDHSRLTMNDATVQSSTQDPLAISLDIPDTLEGESLLLEVRMLDPLFSIEIKKLHKYSTEIESAKRVCDETSICGNQLHEMVSDSKHTIKVRPGSNTNSQDEIQELKPNSICTVERTFQHITDPIILQKLEETLEKNESKALNEGEDDARLESVSSVTDGVKKCQRPCKSLPILTGINDVDDQTEDNPQIKMASSSTMQETELSSVDEREELDEIYNHSKSTTNYSYCGVDEVASNVSYDQSIEERLNVAPSRLDDFESFEDYCCDGESDGVDMDINVFTGIVATQLRELSTEAAIRCQRRIQTLISNSRLESEKNKKVSINR